MEMQLKPIRAQINKWHDLLLLYFLNEEEGDENQKGVNVKLMIYDLDHNETLTNEETLIRLKEEEWRSIDCYIEDYRSSWDPNVYLRIMTYYEFENDRNFTWMICDETENEVIKGNNWPDIHLFSFYEFQEIQEKESE